MRYLSTAEAAERLSVHPNTIARYVQKGTLKAVRVGRLLKFLESDLAAALPSARAVQPFWTLIGNMVCLDPTELGPRYAGLHYEQFLTTVLADPEQFIRHLQRKTWWRAGMADEIRAIVQQSRAAKQAVA